MLAKLPFTNSDGLISTKGQPKSSATAFVACVFDVPGGPKRHRQQKQWPTTWVACVFDVPGGPKSSAEKGSFMRLRRTSASVLFAFFLIIRVSRTDDKGVGVPFSTTFISKSLLRDDSWPDLDRKSVV